MYLQELAATHTGEQPLILRYSWGRAGRGVQGVLLVNLLVLGRGSRVIRNPPVAKKWLFSGHTHNVCQAWCPSGTETPWGKLKVGSRALCIQVHAQTRRGSIPGSWCCSSSPGSSCISFLLPQPQSLLPFEVACSVPSCSSLLPALQPR